mmetsp:Transcript_12797/g.28037  ORF Transcript_12797/g.28037 Transcript_12797/m.28037 type:complete len:116 (+) Transcript_12797:142-489(+)
MELEPGTVVLWTRSDTDVPQGSLGVVKSGQAGLMRVGFPGGTWNFYTTALSPLQMRDYVLYSGNDPEIPQEAAGIVVGLQAAGMISVKYARGVFNVPYKTLRYIDEITAKREGYL